VLLYAFAAGLLFLHGVTTGAIHWTQHLIPHESRHDRIFRLLQWFLAGPTGPWVKAFALSAIALAIRGAQRMRKRIIVLSFANLTGEDFRKALADGLARRLMTELAEIADIYSDVSDDPTGISLDQGKASSLALAVDPTTAISGLTASFKEPVKLGPLSIPVDAVVTLLSTLLRGPQIAGTVQQTAGGLLIEASISGGGFDKTWRVSQSDAEASTAVGDSDAKIVDEMIRQLACRVFTYLNRSELGTQIWRAVKPYTEGLRAFRDARRERGQTVKRMRLLQQAQQAFFSAYSQDARFVRSRYNLGVIYFLQQQWQPAYEIFQKVINDAEGDPLPSTPGTSAFKRARRDLALAHFAAAKTAVELETLVHQEKQNQLETLRKLMLELPEKKENLTEKKKQILEELAQLKQLGQSKQQERQQKQRELENLEQLGRLEKLWKLDGPDRQNKLEQLEELSAQEKWNPARSGRPEYHCNQAITVAPGESGAWNLLAIRTLPADASMAGFCFRKATALSWWNLCSAEWKARPTTNLLAQCITFLADQADGGAELKRSRKEIGQALGLDPSNDANWARLGKLLLAAGKYKKALEAFHHANREQETGRYWLWIACTELLMRQPKLANGEKRKQLAEEAFKRATEGVAGEWLFENSPQQNKNRVAKFETEWKQWTEKNPMPGEIQLRMKAELEKIGKLKTSIENNAVILRSPPSPNISQEEQEELIWEANENFRTDIAARMAVSDAAALQSNPWPNWQSPDDYKQRHGLILNALELRPLGARERSLFAGLLFDFKLLERSEVEMNKALSLQPDGSYQEQFPEIYFQVFLTITDKKVRAKVIRRIWEICGDLTATDGAETESFRRNPRGTLFWHFMLGVYSFELLEFQTAQKSFEICFARFYKPVESLQRLCLAHFRCGAFEEAERAYTRLSDYLQNSALQAEGGILQLTRKSIDIEETLPPAYHRALAANHSAAAMAEQGLVDAAAERWKEGKDWGEKLVTPWCTESGFEYLNDPKYLNESKRGLNAAQDLCRGAILLNAGKLAAAVTDPMNETAPLQYRYKGTEHVWQLEKAIECFTKTILGAFDTSVRADANYRIGVACEALARLDPDRAAIWRPRGRDALRIAQFADRRDEYADRIPPLLQMLAEPAKP
jgi:lipoprotein NlpI